MDQNKYIEVTIFEPVTEVPTSDIADRHSSKILNTIHECDTSNISHSYFTKNMEKNMSPSTNFKPNIRRISSSEEKVDSVSNSDRPLDIDLLLRYYACNSNMEKSIYKLFENAEEKDFKRPNTIITDKVCQDIIEVPLVELGAVCKICESLNESSSKSALFATFRFHDILSKLRSLIRRCNNKTLEEILTNDPSLRMCKHCGVISCSRPRNTDIEPQKSQPTTSYFLSTKMFSDIESSGDDDPRAYSGGNRFNPRREQPAKRIGKWGNVEKHFNRSKYKQHKDGGKIYKSRAVSLNVKPETDFHSNTLQQVETMVAEREDSNGSEEICVESNFIRRRALNESKLEPKSWDKNSKIIKESSNKEIATTMIKDGASRRIKVASSLKNKDTMGNCIIGSSTSCNCNMSPGKHFSQTDYRAKFNNVLSNKKNKWGTLMKNHPVADEYNEKVVKDILYETPNSQLDDFMPANDLSLVNKKRSDVEQNQSTNVFNNTTPPINIMAYLARSHVEPIDKRKHELVSQLDNRTYEQSKYFNNRHSFPGHNDLHSKPYLNSEYWIGDKLIKSDHTVADKDKVAKILLKILENDSKYSKSQSNEATTNIEQIISATCLMEDDSLENCNKGSNTLVNSHESNATAFSSSSAENMIREWVNVPPSSEGSSFLDETREGLNTFKSSVPRSSSKFQTLYPNERCVYCEQKTITNHLQSCTARKTWSSALSRNQPKLLHPSKQIVSCSLDVDSEIPSRLRSTNEQINSSNAKKGRPDKSKIQLTKHVLDSLKRIKRPRSMRSEEKNSNVTSTSASSNNSFLGNCFENINRRIIYNESSLKNIIDKNGNCNKIENILLVYRSVLENTEKMDWQSFQRFVEDLHPNQKALWRDICNAINNEVTRIDGKSDGSTEICIEITSIPLNEMNHERMRGNEIVFEMDIALGDIEKCLARQFTSTEKEHLDTLNGASDVIKVQNDDVYYSEVVSNQAE